ncbi:MAG: response regulator [Polyangiales bacterium]
MKLVALLVEDDPDVRSAVTGILEYEGYEAVPVITVNDALARLAGGGIDVVILDLGLPNRTGDELLHEMQRRNVEVPVVIASASPSAQNIASMYGLPCVSKPFDLELLVSAISVAIDRKMAPRFA